MKVLVIEDDPNKAEQVISFLKTLFGHGDDVIHKTSYQSGLRQLYSDIFDFVILDMSLPTYDIKPGEDAYKFRHLGGHDILSELKRKKKQAKVVILTQFERFGEGNQFVTLSDIKRILRRDFSENYLTTVSYHPNKTAWQEELTQLIRKHTT
jgi:CheY-like chemotaxis protein